MNESKALKFVCWSIEELHNKNYKQFIQNLKWALEEME